MKIGIIQTLKIEIIPPKFYELLIKKELKGDTDLDLNNFYNHTKTCLNAVNRLQEYLLTAYHSTKRHFEFEEYFAPDRVDHFYSWDAQTYTYLGHSLLV